jgi:hypothetical protein
MINIMNFPLLIFALSFIVLVFSVNFGHSLQVKLHPLHPSDREGFNVIQGATLTLLALIIGFTFSMAVSRYDQRKNYEEDEANAIGTEYVRADLLPDSAAVRVRQLLTSYLEQRILFYTTRSPHKIEQINADTTRLQDELWTSVNRAGPATPLIALVVSGMNDVLNSQGYTQAAWWNRIPIGAWILMGIIAIGCNVLIGYSALRKSRFLFLVLPLVISISFFLIADIDSPRGGVIRVSPKNLISLSHTLQVH